MSTIDISLLLPTRARKELVERFFNSVIECTADLSKIEIVLYVDDDDLISQQIEEPRINIKKIVGFPASMGYYNTQCLLNASGEILMLVNDDMVFKTVGWDKKIFQYAESVKDKIFLAAPYDLEESDIPAFPIISRKTYEIIKDPYPEEYEHLYIDTHLNEIFQRLDYLGHKRFKRFDDIVIDHRHFIDGKVRSDAVYAHKNRYKDFLTFIKLRKQRQNAAERLAGYIRNEKMPEYNKQICNDSEPKSLSAVFFNYGPIFLSDKGLPLYKRMISFLHFAKYFAAMKSGFWFLRRKSYTLYGCGD